MDAGTVGEGWGMRGGGIRFQDLEERRQSQPKCVLIPEVPAAIATNTAASTAQSTPRSDELPSTYYSTL